MGGCGAVDGGAGDTEVAGVPPDDLLHPPISKRNGIPGPGTEGGVRETGEGVCHMWPYGEISGMSRRASARHFYIIS